jgi:hypothetical protein
MRPSGFLVECSTLGQARTSAGGNFVAFKFLLCFDFGLGENFHANEKWRQPVPTYYMCRWSLSRNGRYLADGSFSDGGEGGKWENVQGACSARYFHFQL